MQLMNRVDWQVTTSYLAWMQSMHRLPITERPVGLLANRIYDGTRNLSGADVSITTGVEGETLSYSGATVSAKDVGSKQ
jgi:hypothetical protein